MSEFESHVANIQKEHGRRYVLLDIDNYFFVKPSTSIEFRHSPNRRGFHVRFRRDTISDEDFYKILMPTDKRWLCHCIVQGFFRIARIKGSRKGKLRHATKWKWTTNNRKGVEKV